MRTHLAQLGDDTWSYLWATRFCISHRREHTAIGRAAFCSSNGVAGRDLPTTNNVMEATIRRMLEACSRRSFRAPDHALMALVGQDHRGHACWAVFSLLGNNAGAPGRQAGWESAATKWGFGAVLNGDATGGPGGAGGRLVARERTYAYPYVVDNLKDADLFRLDDAAWGCLKPFLRRRDAVVFPGLVVPAGQVYVSPSGVSSSGDLGYLWRGASRYTAAARLSVSVESGALTTAGLAGLLGSLSLHRARRVPELAREEWQALAVTKHADGEGERQLGWRMAAQMRVRPPARAERDAASAQRMAALKAAAERQRPRAEYGRLLSKLRPSFRAPAGSGRSLPVVAASKTVRVDAAKRGRKSAIARAGPAAAAAAAPSAARGSVGRAGAKSQGAAGAAASAVQQWDEEEVNLDGP